MSWKIKKIKILPFGGITIFENPINIPLKQEFLVSISGVMFQTLGSFILSKFYDKTLFINIHYTLLIFNLLPIFPLDGSKIWNVFFNYFLPFKKSHICSIIISSCFLFLLVISLKSFSSLLIFFFLIRTEITEIKNHKVYFYKFLLERYMYSFNYSKILYIYNIEQMRKEYYHYIRFQSEKTFLKKLFE